jgi:hypothetical protein
MAEPMAAMIKAVLLSHLSRAIRIPLSYTFDKAIHLTQIHTLYLALYGMAF